MKSENRKKIGKIGFDLNSTALIRNKQKAHNCTRPQQLHCNLQCPFIVTAPSSSSFSSFSPTTALNLASPAEIGSKKGAPALPTLHQPFQRVKPFQGPNPSSIHSEELEKGLKNGASSISSWQSDRQVSRSDCYCWMCVRRPEKAS